MSQHLFSEIPKVNIPRSVFNRNFNLKTTINTDYLYPIFCDEVLPGDTVNFNQHIFARLATPIVPIMDGLYLDTFFFAVPCRLLWKDWEKFMGARPFGDTTTVYQVPQLNTGDGVAVGSLSDYMGIPTGVPNLDFSSLWHRAYNLIYNEWFRDENLCEPVKIGGLADDGTQTTETLADYTLLKRCKRHDYFTSCLPWPQKGDPASISLAGSGGLSYKDETDLAYTSLYSPVAASKHLTLSTGSAISADSATKNISIGTNSVTDTAFFRLGPSQLEKIAVDFDNVSAVSINELRNAFAVQRFLETTARSGSRYIEILRGHFGVVSPDARMQRPEYLGGDSVPISMTSVSSTAGVDFSEYFGDAVASRPIGSLGAFATCSHHCTWSKSFTEHCVILGLANVRADLSYQQGLPVMFQRKERFDFYWPEFANLGEAPVLNKTIFAQGKSVVDSDGAIIDDGVFGYQERWAEYRYHPNMITGQFRSTYAQSLDVWHLAQKFDNLPTLSQTFIEEAVPISRCIATPDEPALILDGWFESKWARPLPLYSVPGLATRF